MKTEHRDSSLQRLLTSNSGVFFGALLCCALWGSAFPCIKIGYRLFQIENPGSQILFAGYRFFLAGILTVLLGSVIERRIIRIRRTSVAVVFGQGLLQTTLQYLFFYLGLANTTGSKGSVINASSTFFSILAAHLLLKNEKLNIRKTVGCLIGFAGVILVNLAPGAWNTGFSLKGEGLVLICSICYGVSSVTLKRISDRETPTAITAYQLLFGGAILILIGFCTGGRVTGFTLASSLLLLYMALLSTIAFCIWTALLKYNPVGRIAVFGFSIPIFGSLLSGIFLKENIVTFSNLCALVLVSAGILIVNTTFSWVLPAFKRTER